MKTAIDLIAKIVVAMGIGIGSAAFGVAICVSNAQAFQSQSASADDPLEDAVRAILEENCFECHSGESPEAGLNLTSMLATLKGGDSGEPTIVPGESVASHLIARVTSNETVSQMPPGTRLSDVEIQVLKSWIDTPALWELAAAELESAPLDHWSFQPLSDSAQHSLSQPSLDRFVEEQLNRANLQLSSQASKRRLVRRLYLVMLGILPTNETVDAFENDDSPDAWKRLVDQVLASPQYGERMASYWLDIVRYGDTTGFETNRERAFAYHYRDWIIESLNQDMPYDDFVIAQLAGDAIGQARATGFLVAGPNDIVKGQDQLLGLMQRQDELTDIVNTVGTAFLGLTTGCARCHNHKFDPISQADFYALQAIFSGVAHADSVLPPSREQLTAIQDATTELSQLRQALAPWEEHKLLRTAVNAKGNEERFPAVQARLIRYEIDATNGGEPCLDELEIFAAGTNDNIALAAKGAIATSSGDFDHPFHKLKHINDGVFGNEHSWIASEVANSWVQIELPTETSIDRIVWARDRDGVYGDRLPLEYSIVVAASAEDWSVIASSEDRESFGSEPKSIAYRFESVEDEARRKELETQSERARQLQDRLDGYQRSEMAYIGQFVEPTAIYRLFRGDPLAPREVVRPGGIKSLRGFQLPSEATDRQRRLALARWLVDRENPLTARVMVNRIWQFHFGTGIVDTPSDFGRNGAEPTHPELLDWLAEQFMERNWSIKELHRQIIDSQVWQQDSRPNPKGTSVDAGNRLLWRFPPRRLEAEAIRDNMLFVSGTLDWTVGGPGFSPFEISMENVRHYFPKATYEPSDWRRMVYMLKVRQEREATFGAFDCPDATQTVPKRGRSTTPLQSLNLLNSSFVLQQAEYLAKRLERASDNRAEQIAHAYSLCFGRSPSEDEANVATDFIQQHGLNSFTRAMLNANEFLFIP